MTSENFSGEELLGEIRSTFSFLDDPISQSVVVERDSSSLTVAYIMDPVTVEVNVDWRESAVELLLCRTIDGGRPPGWYAYEGRRMRILLYAALRSGPPQFRALGVEREQAGRKFEMVGPRERTAGLLRADADCIRALLPELDAFYRALFAD